MMKPILTAGRWRGPRAGMQPARPSAANAPSVPPSRVRRSNRCPMAPPVCADNPPLPCRIPPRRPGQAARGQIPPVPGTAAVRTSSVDSMSRRVKRTRGLTGSRSRAVDSAALDRPLRASDSSSSSCFLVAAAAPGPRGLDVGGSVTARSGCPRRPTENDYRMIAGGRHRAGREHTTALDSAGSRSIPECARARLADLRPRAGDRPDPHRGRTGRAVLESDITYTSREGH